METVGLRSESMDSKVKHYLLVPGTYHIGRALKRFKKLTYFETSEQVIHWINAPEDGATSGITKGIYIHPLDHPVPLSYFDRATDQERRDRGDDLYLLDYDMFREFKDKVLYEMKRFNVHCNLEEFKVFKIGKGMTVTNVVSLLQNIMGKEFNIPFEYIKRRTSCRVIRFEPIYYAEFHSIIRGRRDSDFIKLRKSHNYDAPPVEIRMGDHLSYSEYVHLRFRGEEIPSLQLLDYINERSKVYAFLTLFSTYHYNPVSQVMEPNAVEMGGNASFDHQFLFHILNIYYGNEENVNKQYSFY